MTGSAMQGRYGVIGKLTNAENERRIKIIFGKLSFCT